ncbi:hypothetical protein [Synechococcus sp. CS-1328]|uniref:hypothetical protein n=1 Tax=Synechococcus sp. CS-1328 TaxID=2847976 RepID=UPI00223B14B5|nr:hypothetical protein [Synechococcus sp. CS-1328]MCT0224748.1 hypothetical protein [Synechococcus sp. CS-1328]
MQHDLPVAPAPVGPAEVAQAVKKQIPASERPAGQHRSPGESSADTVGAIVMPFSLAMPSPALLPAVMRCLEKVQEPSRRLQRLSRQGWLDDIPPAMLASAQGEAA